jgi:prophage regulatory protein
MKNEVKKNVLIRRRAVEARTGLKRSAIYAHLSDGNFPKPVKIGERMVAWIESEVDEWVSNRIAASRVQQQRINNKEEVCSL